MKILIHLFNVFLILSYLEVYAVDNTISTEKNAPTVTEREILLPKIGENWIVPLSEDTTLEMIYIPPGTFEMGSPENEPGRSHTEKLHSVTLTKGYWLGKYEVTQKQWQAIMGNTFSVRWNCIREDIPVHNIDWYYANYFCKRLNEREIKACRLPRNYRYVLPTEAQWEYACRAGTKTELNNGKDITAIYKAKFFGFGEALAFLGFEFGQGYWTDCPNLNEVAWWRNNSNGKVHPVGQKKPNVWGLYDMHGNVAEWCADRWEDYPSNKNSFDPISRPANTNSLNDRLNDRILRGGCYDSITDCRQADRFHNIPSVGFEHMGFRLALVYFDTEKDIPTNSIQIQFADITEKKEEKGGSTPPVSKEEKDIESVHK